MYYDSFSPVTKGVLGEPMLQDLWAGGSHVANFGSWLALYAVEKFRMKGEVSGCKSGMVWVTRT
jgi:hypothetical protein